MSKITVTNFEDILRELPEYQRKLRAATLETGYPELDHVGDEKAGVLIKGELTVLSGMTCMGKSILALNIASHLAYRRGKNVCLFCPEMGEHTSVARLASSMTGIPFRSILDGTATSQAVKDVLKQKKGIFLLNERVRTVGEIIEQVRELPQEQKPELVVVDAFTSLSPEDGQSETDMVNRLKQAAKDLNVAVLLVAHLESSGAYERKDQRPDLDDLWVRCSALVTAADTILFVHRMAKMDKRCRSSSHEAEVTVEKHRHGGSGAMAKLWFNGEVTRFENPKSEQDAQK